MEMSFISEERIMVEIEDLLRGLWTDLLNIKLVDQFPRMTYQEAMASYGSDKPDLRFTPTVCRPYAVVITLLIPNRYTR